MKELRIRIDISDPEIRLRLCRLMKIEDAELNASTIVDFFARGSNNLSVDSSCTDNI